MTFGLELGGDGSGVFLCELLRGSWNLTSLFDNSVYLDSILLLFNTLFHLIVLHLLGVEALTVVLLHGAVSVHCLHETNHGLIAFGVEIDVITSSNTLETRCSVIERVVTDRVLNIIAEITNESLTIIKLDSKCLIVNGTPSAVDFLAVFALVFGSAFGC